MCPLCYADARPDSYSLAQLLICGITLNLLAVQLVVNLSHLERACQALHVGFSTGCGSFPATCQEAPGSVLI